MNRFEQDKVHFTRKITYPLPILAFVLLLILFLQGVHSVSDTTLAKQQESLETALTRSIAQCYAVEGAYPPSADYLTEHYGLTYNKNIFLIDYKYYGGNLRPQVTVLRKYNQAN